MNNSLTSEKALDILSDIMREETCALSEEEKQLDKIYMLANTELRKFLDSEKIPNSAAIITRTTDALESYLQLIRIPCLAGKSIIKIQGISKAFSDFFENDNELQSVVMRNKTLPMFIINGSSNYNGKIYILTYSDKLLEISTEYYFNLFLIEKFGPEIKRLIKCVICYSDISYDNTAFLFIPQFCNAFCETAVKMSDFLTFKANCTYLQWFSKNSFYNRVFIPDSEYQLSEITINETEKKKLCKLSELNNYCKNINIARYNFYLSAVLKNILYDIDAYFSDSLFEISEFLQELKKDNERIDENSHTKLEIISRIDALKKRQDSLISLKKEYKTIENIILKEASVFETLLFKRFNNSDRMNTDGLCSIYVNLFLKYTEHSDTKSAGDILSALAKLGYKNIDILKIYFVYCSANKITPAEKEKIKSAKNKESGIIKIKIAMLDCLDYDDESLIEFSKRISHPQTGNQFYCAGLAEMKKGNLSNAVKLFYEALERNCKQAGDKLMQLYENCPQANVSLFTLANNLVPQANYAISKTDISSPSTKVLYLKISACLLHLDALEEVADYKYNKIKTTYSDSKSKEAYLIIDIYSHLAKEKSGDTNKIKVYKEKIGILYYLLDDGARSYNYLCDLESPEAKYYCGLLLMDGNGVSVSLNKAKKFLKIAKDFEIVGAAEKYTEVNRMIREKSEKTKTEEVINPNNTSYSSYCFITTATCLALGEKSDCHQLNILRKFRDNHIGNSTEGQLLIDEYYRIGPVLVEKINAQSDSFLIYQMLWEEYIKPSCEMIDNEKKSEAKMIYIIMVKYLCEKFKVPVDKIIMKKYRINI